MEASLSIEYQIVSKTSSCSVFLAQSLFLSFTDTGKTCYMFTGDPDDWYNPPLVEDTETEIQYLVKWVGWSHLHNTWESGELKIFWLHINFDSCP